MPIQNNFPLKRSLSETSLSRSVLPVSIENMVLYNDFEKNAPLKKSKTTKSLNSFNYKTASANFRVSDDSLKKTKTSPTLLYLKRLNTDNINPLLVKSKIIAIPPVQIPLEPRDISLPNFDLTSYKTFYNNEPVSPPSTPLARHELNEQNYNSPPLSPQLFPFESIKKAIPKQANLKSDQEDKSNPVRVKRYSSTDSFLYAAYEFGKNRAINTPLNNPSEEELERFVEKGFQEFIKQNKMNRKKP